MTKTIKLNLKGLRGEARREAKTIAGEILVEETLKDLDRSRSPVKDAPYKRKKKDGTLSELREDGDLWASITFEETAGGVKYGVFNDLEAPKAFNHNTGDTLPTRRFIPRNKEMPRDPIMNKVNRAVQRIRDREGLDQETTTAADLRRDSGES